MRVLVIEVAAHQEHDVVSAIVASLKKNHLDERLNTLIHVVVKQTLVILWKGRWGKREERGNIEERERERDKRRREI